jgi:hypothetical protein
MATRSTPWLAGLALAVACGCLVVLLVDSGRDSSPEVQAPAETAKGDASEAAGGGDTGSQGVAGTTGSAGLPEAVIAEGPAGPRGRTGEAGPAGTAGPAGSAGATGPQGCEGPEGPAGPVGETGPQGCEGPVGAPGAPGPAGPQGTAGADGKTILNGSGPPSDEEGAEGDFYIDTTASEIYGPKTGSGWGAGTSEVGPAGSSVLSGTGPPGASLGADGDFYIDTSVNSIYGPKASGAWGVSVPLVGPQGPAGATGPEGPQGVQGPPGVDAANVPLYRGSFYSTGDQSPSGGTNVVPINLNETDISQGVDLVNPGSASVRVVHAGTYNFQFSAQVTKTDSGTDVLYIWPQVDRDGAGATYSWEDVTWSNSSITLFAKDDRNIAAWNFVLPVDDGAYFRMVMSSANTGFLIDSVTSPPVGPALPGMILTVTRAG